MMSCELPSIQKAKLVLLRGAPAALRNDCAAGAVQLKLREIERGTFSAGCRDPKSLGAQKASAAIQHAGAQLFAPWTDAC